MRIQHSDVYMCVCCCCQVAEPPAVLFSCGRHTPLHLTRASLTSRTRSTPLMTRFKAVRACRMCPGNQVMLREPAPIVSAAVSLLLSHCGC